ncbi:MAG TPA: hypothetical protein VK753_10605 [Xanthomonadaceae bacterium]|jgi:hypothetical protein|nr:hypothetical protein [Xanthomonadaceae bacterium]
MQHHAKPDPVVEDTPLLALRRTLWQLAVVGVAAAVAIDRIAPDARALAIWCALVPFSALAVHLRYELWSLCSRPRRADAPRIRARRGRTRGASRRR